MIPGGTRALEIKVLFDQLNAVSSITEVSIKICQNVQYNKNKQQTFDFKYL